MNEGTYSERLDLWHASTDRATLVVVPPRQFLAVSGIGDPSSGDFVLGAGVLREISRELRSVIARRGVKPTSTVVETLWSPRDDADLPRAFAERTLWRWQQLLEIPAEVTPAETETAVDTVRSAAGRATPLVRDVAFAEGPAMQMLHVGGWRSQAATLGKLLDAMGADGFVPTTAVHVLRVGDEDIVEPKRARSIIRVPIERGNEASPPLGH